MERAYEHFNLPGVGRSFFTKWFTFAGHRDRREWQPLILDDRVLSTLNGTLELRSRDLAGSRLWARRYRCYVEAVHHWAHELLPALDPSAGAQRLEWIMFDYNGGGA